MSFAQHAIKGKNMATKSKGKNPTIRTRRWRGMMKLNPLEFGSDPALFDDKSFSGGVLVHTPIPAQSDHLISVNPCVRAYGHSKSPNSCHACIKLRMNVADEERIVERGRIIKVVLNVCPEREGTHAPGINHETFWPACGRFEPAL